MHTRCPGCQAVHPVTAAVLAQGNGLYRCGHCRKVSNALQNLFDHWPDADEAPVSAQFKQRQLPVLGSEHPLETPPAGEDEEDFELPDDLLEAWGEPTSRSRRNWAIAAGAMAVVTLLNVVFVSGDALLAQPSIRGALQGMGLVEAPAAQTWRDLDLLHLASSEMHSHPTLDDTLVLNATIVNRADRAQPYPALQITLLDAQAQPLAARVFVPEEYLPDGAGAQTGMPPGDYLPVIMELRDPGSHAVGFEMNFQ